MIKPIALLAVVLALFQLAGFSQESKQFQLSPKRISVSLPANTLPFPFRIAHSDSLPVDLIIGNLVNRFPGTVYFNPAEKIGHVKNTSYDLPAINAIRLYLDTAAWDITVNDLLNLPDLSLRVIGNNIGRFFSPFYFKKCEVTNQEYREFTIWVRDSIARSLLAQIYPDRYYNGHTKTLNWGMPIDWEGKDENAAEALKELFYAENERFYLKKEFNTGMFIYTYTDGNHNVKSIPIYPDTLVWFRDFPYSFNEFQFRYFNHKAYNNYPVTGVSYEQAKAFCHWKTKQIQKTMSPGLQVEVDLPFDYEREYVITQYDPRQEADMGCIADLMAVKKQEFFPVQLDEIMKCSNSIHEDKDILLFRTHQADLSTISPRKRISISTDIDENNISGINSNLSEWMNESYQANWLPFITKRRQLLESLMTNHWDAEKSTKSPDSLFFNSLRYEYSKEIPLILQLEELFNGYCDTDGRLVRGGNWIDSRCLFSYPSGVDKKMARHKDPMTFVSPTKSSSMIGFRYVIRIKNALE